MNIIYYSKIDNINMDLWQKIHIIDTLKSMNHKVYFVNYDKRTSLKKINSIIKKIIMNYHIELLITPLSYREIDKEILNFCNKMKIKKYLIFGL
jgi:hypothetical protein